MDLGLWFARGLLVVGHGLFLVCLCFAVCGSFLCCVPCVPWCPLVFPRVPCVSFFARFPFPCQDRFINHSFSKFFLLSFRGGSLIAFFEFFCVFWLLFGTMLGSFWLTVSVFFRSAKNRGSRGGFGRSSGPFSPRKCAFCTRIICVP